MMAEIANADVPGTTVVADVVATINKISSTHTGIYFNDFPFLNDEASISYIANNKCMFILRGVSGQGKTTLANEIVEKYSSILKNSNKGHKRVICASADDYFLYDGVYKFAPEQLGEAHNACQNKARNACFTDANIVIIDNTNTRLWEMEYYLSMARHFNYVVIIVVPETPWRYDPKVLREKSLHHVSVETIERKLLSFETAVPLYFGWFPGHEDCQILHNFSSNLLEQCWWECEQFRIWSGHIIGNTSLSEVDLQLYYYGSLRGKPKANISCLHVTSMFCGRGQECSALSYTTSPIVTASLGKVFKLEVTGFLITKDTFGARIRLPEAALILWNQSDKLLIRHRDHGKACPAEDCVKYDNKVARGCYIRFVYNCISNIVSHVWCLLKHLWGMIFQANVKDKSENKLSVAVHPLIAEVYDCPRGSRAHITLGYADHSRPVQTGYDQLQLLYDESLSAQVECDEYTIQLAHESVFLRCFKQSIWAVYLNQPISLHCLFTGCY